MTPQPFKFPGHLQFLYGLRRGTPTVKLHKATLSIVAPFEHKAKRASSDQHEAHITDRRNQRFRRRCLAVVWAPAPSTLSTVSGCQPSFQCLHCFAHLECRQRLQCLTCESFLQYLACRQVSGLATVSSLSMVSREVYIVSSASSLQVDQRVLKAYSFYNVCGVFTVEEHPQYSLCPKPSDCLGRRALSVCAAKGGRNV